MPSNLDLQVIHPVTGSHITRDFQAGEYAKVILKFKIPENSAANYIANIRFMATQVLTIYCPHVISVGRSILWADRAVNCLFCQFRSVKLI